MIFGSKKTLAISIVVFLLFFLTLPLSIIPAIVLFLYVYWFKGGDFRRVINRIEMVNGIRLLIACGFTSASIAIYQSANYATHLGFPSPFITYHNLLDTGGTSPLWRRLAVDPFAASVNVVIYYMLLSLIYWVYRQGALRLGKN